MAEECYADPAPITLFHNTEVTLTITHRSLPTQDNVHLLDRSVSETVEHILGDAFRRVGHTFGEYSAVAAALALLL